MISNTIPSSHKIWIPSKKPKTNSTKPRTTKVTHHLYFVSTN
jgi:hypothetical protein